MQASNAAMGTVAVVYSLGISALFRRSAIHWVWELCLEHYRLVLMYSQPHAAYP